MDPAVSLVQAYLQVNGYFTVAEYPVVAERRHGAPATLTDLDLLGVRFPGAGWSEDRRGRRTGGTVSPSPDPALGAAEDHPDMVVAEVKQGAAHLNPAMRDPRVLETALARFGCCPSGHVEEVVRHLLANGRARTPGGHQVRILAFGSAPGGGHRVDRSITLEHAVGFLRRHLERHWDVVGRTVPSQPALGFLTLLEKARRGGRHGR